MENGETFPFIINLTPKAAACVIEGLAEKCAHEVDMRNSLYYDTESLDRRYRELETRLNHLEDARGKGAK